MALRLSPLLAVLTAVVIGAPGPRATAREPARTEPRVLFKVRPGVVEADAARIVTARLTKGLGVARGWMPRSLRRVFAQRPASLAAKDRGAGLDRVYLSALPQGLDMDEAVALLAGDPRVEYAQPDHVRESHILPDSSGPPSDPFFGSSGSWGQSYGDQWALPKLNVEHAWDLSHADGIVVAVVDSGVDYYHPELSGRMWANPEEAGQGPSNGYPGDTMGWDFVANDNDPQDAFGHGTHMAGIIAAETDNGIGIAGVAPAARIMAVRAIAGAGKGTSSTIAAGIVYAADNGAHVIAVSSGCVTRCPSDPVVEQAVRHASAKGALVVISAGNNGDNLAWYSPQNMVDARPIVVNATDELDRRESFGNVGDFLDLAAPGGGRNPAPAVVDPVSNILSLAAGSCAPIVCIPSKLVGSGLLRRAGTSMSAAYVAGVAALVLGEDPLRSATSARRKLFANAQDFGPGGYDPYFGWGRLTALNSVADLRRFILARILAPAAGATVSGIVRIAGAADARTFQDYEVSVGAGVSPTAWTTTGITAFATPTTQGDLARWKTDGLAGPWTIRLLVRDTVGGTRESRRTVTVAASPSWPGLIVDVASEGPGTGTVQADPPRASCDGVPGSTQTCTYPFDAPTQVTLTAVPHGLAVFAGWSGACSGTGPCTVNVAAREFVRAAFIGPYRLEAGGLVDPPGVECDTDGHCGPPLYRAGTEVTIFYADPIVDYAWYWIPEPWPTPPLLCGRQYGGVSCVVVMDRGRVIRAGLERTPRPDPIMVGSGYRMYQAFGAVNLSPSVFQLQYPPRPLFYSWYDETTGQYLGDTPTLSPALAVGLHYILFDVWDDTEPVNNHAWTRYELFVRDP